MDKNLEKFVKLLQSFEVMVAYDTRDQFISSVRRFFESHFNGKSSYWIKVPKTEIQRPPLLACREEIKKQEVHLFPVINLIDRCEKIDDEGTCVQIWKTSDNKDLGLFWFLGPENWIQCLILPEIQNFDKAFHELLQPIIQRRWELCLAVEKTQQEVFRDGLTGLYNQRFLNMTLNQKIKEQKRYNTPFTILFIDVDHFKKVNDSSGHLVGSSVLVEIGKLIERSVRGSDFAFRYGGDEFIALLSHTKADSATIVAERIRKEIEAEKFFVSGEEVKVTVSIGIAGYPENASSAEEIIEMADKAMYYGKNQGRNIIYKAS